MIHSDQILLICNTFIVQETVSFMAVTRERRGTTMHGIRKPHAFRILLGYIIIDRPKIYKFEIIKSINT